MYKKKTSGWSQHLDFMGLDILCLEVAMVFGMLLYDSWFNLSRSFVFWALCLGAGIIDLLVMLLMDAYHNVIRRDSFEELKGVLTQTVYLTVGMIIYTFLLRDDQLNLFHVLVPSMPFYGVLSFNMRVLWKEYLRKRLHLKNRRGMLAMSLR